MNLELITLVSWSWIFICHLFLMGMWFLLWLLKIFEKEGLENFCKFHLGLIVKKMGCSHPLDWHCVNLLCLWTENLVDVLEYLFLAFWMYIVKNKSMWFWFLMQMIVDRVDSHPLILNVKLVINEIVRGIAFGVWIAKICLKWVLECKHVNQLVLNDRLWMNDVWVTP